MILHVSRQSCAESCRQRDGGDLRCVIKPEKWRRVMDGLERNGFFEGEIEGSTRYREKAAMAEVIPKITKTSSAGGFS